MGFRSLYLTAVLWLAASAASAAAQGAVFCITDFGAVADGKTMNTRSIQTAVDQCAETGGGTVLVPAGTFLTGTLRLRTKVTLHLDNGAVLKGSPDVADYVLDGRRVGLLYTHGEKNVAITGFGSIDGNEAAFFVWDKPKRIDPAGLKFVRQKERFREVAAGIGDGPVVPLERPFQMVIFSECENVLVRDVTLSGSPFWTLHFADCDGVVVSGVKIWGSLFVPNNDGIDLTTCRNALVSDCDIRTGDDCIAITGYDHHFDLPGFNGIRGACENINVTNCNLVSRSAGIRIGGLDQNPMRNCHFSNINITHSNRGIGLFLRDAGSIENMTFNGITIETRLHTGDWWGQGEPIHVSAVRLTAGVALGKIKNIRFSKVQCTGESGILVYGSEESVIENVSFEGLVFKLTDSPLNRAAGGNFDLRPVLDERLQLFEHDIPAFFARYVKNLTVRDFDLEWGPVRDVFFTNGIEVDRFEGLRIEGFRGSGAPYNSKACAVKLRNGTGAKIESGTRAVCKWNVK